MLTSRVFYMGLSIFTALVYCTGGSAKVLSGMGWLRRSFVKR